MHRDHGKLHSDRPSGPAAGADDEAAEGQVGGAPAADVGPVGRTADTTREQDAGVSGGTGATGATALDGATADRGTPGGAGAAGTTRGGGEGATAAPEEAEDVGVTSPGSDGTDRSLGRDTARGDLVGTATGDLGGADSEDIRQARETGAHEDQS
jgi:hypothetical protein